MLAMSEYCLQDYESAAQYFKKYYERYPKGYYAEQAKYYVGESLYASTPEPRLDQSPTIQAISAYQDFIDVYPDSKLKDQATHRMFELQDKLVIKEYYNAKLYYDLGTYFGNCTSGGNNYQACIVTAQNALSDYPYSNMREQFSILVMKSKYQLAKMSVISKQMERYEDAQDECYGFLNEYPDSKERVTAEKYIEGCKKFIEKHPEFKLADKTRDCYVYEYQKPKSNNNDKELIIEEFNKQLNDADYGKVIYSEINSIPVQESNNMPMVFSEDDVYCNMSKFRNPYNIIFVCGTSGSGKSTLSKYLSDVHNATYVSLDHIMFWINRKPRTDMEVKLFDPTIYKYYKEKGILFDELVEICNSKNRKFFDYAKNRILDYIEWLSNQDEQFIIEGIQTSWVYNKNKFIVYPFIFKGTSMIKSWIRRAMREKDFFYKFDLKIALKWSSEWKK